MQKPAGKTAGGAGLLTVSLPKAPVSLEPTQHLREVMQYLIARYGPAWLDEHLPVLAGDAEQAGQRLTVGEINESDNGVALFAAYRQCWWTHFVMRVNWPAYGVPSTFQLVSNDAELSGLGGGWCKVLNRELAGEDPIAATQVDYSRSLLFRPNGANLVHLDDFD